MLLSSVTKEQGLNVRCMATIGAFNNSQHVTLVTDKYTQSMYKAIFSQGQSTSLSK